MKKAPEDEKLIVGQMGKKFHTVYGTRKFITDFTAACQLTVS
jgi:hypothetical protein